MRPVVLVGVGELGGYFAQGFLRTGYRVIPVRRQDSMATVAKNNPEPEVVIVAVAEADLDDVLANLRDRTALDALSKALEDSAPIVREAAAWALGEFADPSSRAALEDQLVREKLDWVRVRLEQSLSKISLEDH